ncbi:unnamed protein product [Acanthoscelides obtectus]|uniref:Uncharacterized protein n=1 Tax=Acanthoscelides obtectus TaxID=200917 RepID=A0A9P0PEM2_ACAOB|nr:unnamed protein product [Acanthoscelides obtectus]CAK1632818.1 hypothetical protein AOBTE_LOCUS7746 [Acanthoscelides obtectus]
MTYRFLPFGGFFSDFGQILHVIFVKCCFGCIWRDSSATLIWKVQRSLTQGRASGANTFCYLAIHIWKLTQNTA